jgi:magnesium-transporting ATPase (P-type)
VKKELESVPRKYYRKKSTASSMLSDTAYIGRKFPWWVTLTLGVFLFSIFYFFVPSWLLSNINSTHNPMTRSMLEPLILRRLHWFQWLGIALGLVCLFYSFRNYIFGKAYSSQESKIVVFLARILGRAID